MPVIPFNEEGAQAARFQVVTDGLSVLCTLPAAPPLSPALVTAWVEALNEERLPTDTLRAGFRRAYRHSDFFPSVKFVVECVRAARADAKPEIDTRPGLEAPKSDEPTISREERDAILARMKPGARELFQAVIDEARQ